MKKWGFRFIGLLEYPASGIREAIEICFQLSRIKLSVPLIGILRVKIAIALSAAGIP